jgi:hypothetical protein
MIRSMRKSLLFAITAVSIAFPATLFAGGDRSIQAGIALGVMSNRGIGELNDRLESQGYPSFKTGYGTMGGLVRLRFERLMIGIEGHAYRSQPETKGTQEITLAGGYAILETGYDVFRAGGFRLFPMLGIGAGSTRLHIYETQDVTFDGMLADPGRETSVNYGSMIINASIAMEYYLKVTDNTGFVAGFQAGYNQSIYDRGWLFDGPGGRKEAPEATGGPEVKFRGFAATLNVGWLFEL